MEKSVYTSLEENKNVEGVYTAYIRGFVRLRDGTYRDPTSFQTLLRNAVNRGFKKQVRLRRLELMDYLEDKNITPDMIGWIRKNRTIVGEDIFLKLEDLSVMQGT
jgi:hypothetical protein